ncbi:hypothetical protein [Deinococcus cavernae]|uniref:hypothetical protein n=1 Tax=Deinococcus cavernae TaxID=2320857 RepID=UPI0011C21D2C|nr:hypothetical protein [Deinococcus cavernae]
MSAENKPNSFIKNWLVASLSLFTLIMLIAAYKKSFGGYLFIDDFEKTCKNAVKVRYGIPDDIPVYIGIPDLGRMSRGKSLFNGSLINDRRILVEYQFAETKKIYSIRCVIHPQTKTAILVP